MSTIEKYKGLEDALTAQREHERRRKANEDRNRVRTFDALEHLRIRKRWTVEQLADRIGSSDTKTLQKTKGRTFPCANIRLRALKLLEQNGYDVLDLYRCPLEKQGWREKAGWPASRDEWLQAMNQQGTSVWKLDAAQKHLKTKMKGRR